MEELFNEIIEFISIHKAETHHKLLLLVAIYIYTFFKLSLEARDSFTRISLGCIMEMSFIIEDTIYIYKGVGGMNE